MISARARYNQGEHEGQTKYLFIFDYLLNAESASMIAMHDAIAGIDWARNLDIGSQASHASSAAQKKQWHDYDYFSHDAFYVDLSWGRNKFLFSSESRPQRHLMWHTEMRRQQAERGWLFFDTGMLFHREWRCTNGTEEKYSGMTELAL